MVITTIYIGELHVNYIEVPPVLIIAHTSIYGNNHYSAPRQLHRGPNRDRRVYEQLPYMDASPSILLPPVKVLTEAERLKGVVDLAHGK